MRNNNRTALALSLSALLILGTTTFALSRNAYAHTFGGNESAAFLAKVQGLKVEAHLIQSDLSNQTLVAWHSDKIGEFWNTNDTKEMTERNQRLGTDIPALISNITTAANSTNPDATKLGQLITSLDNDLAEATSVRIEKTELENATVNGLAVADILDETMEDYGIATGAEEENSSNVTGSNTTSQDNMSNVSEGAGSNETATIVNFAAYQTAQGLAAAAQDMYNNLKPKAMPNSSSEIAALDAAFANLRKAIDDKMSNDAIQAIVEGSIHPNLSAFGLKEEEG
ncbi:MAG: hypothetical protein M3270_03680 [Thermoproteota archaeon]|nr:hypothetical protein [Thermoproteota archaeon]